MKTSGITDKKEYMQKYSEIAMKNLVNEIKNATYSTDTKEKTYTYVLKDKAWEPEKKETMFKELGQLVSGQTK